MTNSKKYKLAFIGGDARQLIAASEFRRLGYETAIYGFGGDSVTPPRHAVDSLCCSSCTARPYEIVGEYAPDPKDMASTPDEALVGADAVILPLPASSDGIHVSMPFSGGKRISFDWLITSMAANGIKALAGGKLPAGFTEACTESGISVFDYYESEEFAVANAVPTAEGAIEIAMHELPITVNGSSALVIGYGRIGKVLARLLHSLGASVTVSARKPRDIDAINACGYTSANTEALRDAVKKRFDVIFNTVPHQVIGREVLALLSRGTLIIDLASKPGGVDIDEAERRSMRVIWALSLPGKVAPVTSGEIIAQTVKIGLDRMLGGCELC